MGCGKLDHDGRADPLGFRDLETNWKLLTIRESAKSLGLCTNLRSIYSLNENTYIVISINEQA